MRELTAALASEPEHRLAVINAVLADVATIRDINQLGEEVRGEIVSSGETWIITLGGCLAS